MPMEQRLQRAQQLEARAFAARTLAEAQALTAEADRLRGRRPLAAPTSWAAHLLRN